MGNGSIALLKIADKVRTRADGYNVSLESYLDEIKKSGRNITKEDAETIKEMKAKISTELNKHAAIYRLIYEMD